MEGFDSGGISGIGIGHAGVLANKVLHAQHTSHPAGVIAEEDTAEGGEGTDEIRFDGDGGLDTPSVDGPGDDCSSRHDG